MKGLPGIAFSGVENCRFPRLFHTEKRQRPGVENWGRSIPDWRKINHRPETVCRMQRKSFDFLFYKRQNACIFAQNLPESCGLNYGVYRADTLLLWKTRWKKWKTSWKTRPFLHKNGGKPGGKSEKFIPDRKLHTLSGCTFVPQDPLDGCILGRKRSGFPHRGIALNAPANHGTITAENCGKTHRYRNTMRWRHPI